MKSIFTSLIFLCITGTTLAQKHGLRGRVTSEGLALPAATVQIPLLKAGAVTDSLGYFTLKNLTAGSYLMKISAVGHQPLSRKVQIPSAQDADLEIELHSDKAELGEVVISGTLKPVRKIDSPVPVELYNHSFFARNPSPSVFDALQNVNGVRPQLNCNICNTGDIHMNGLEGPYTMVLIDGMPIVSGLSTVYGLSGIPANLIEQVEIVKGPASSLYGSEAVGGLINIITKSPDQSPVLSGDVFATSWQEYNADAGIKFKAGKSATALSGITYYKYNQLTDHNQDGFTDMTLQDRISLFQKWNFTRKYNKTFNLAGRYLYEDRWGGQTNWNKTLRGSGDVYAESIYTKRWELMGNYQLPVKENMFLAFSVNNHNQNSVYGTDWFLARQQIAFGQLTWDKKTGKNDWLFGTALRYTFYDDNTPATLRAEHTWLPGVFVQDEIAVHTGQKLLLGLRYDYHSVHGSIFTPRLAYKWDISGKDILRLNVGTGFRVVNIFTEDHAALTGAREVVIAEALKPEKSYNVNLNYIRKLYSGNGDIFNFDLSAWYTYFGNRITADYDTNPNQIIYNNLKGHGITQGLSTNLDFTFSNGLNLLAGITLMDIKNVETNANGIKEKIRPIKSEKWMGTWSASYTLKPLNLKIDYTGNIIGPMRLALLSPFDPRPANSPVWSIQNIQLTWKQKKNMEVYGGIKNLLNWTISKNILGGSAIARSFDPYDKHVQYGPSGNILKVGDPSQPSSDPSYNPYALKFDPDGYSYGPNQGIRGFLGLRFYLK